MKKKNKPKHRQKKRNHLSFRLNVLFFVVFLLFSALILRLGFVQIVEGETFVSELASTTNATERHDAPRGLMYDRFGHVVVDNQLELSVTYTNPSRTTRAQTMLEIAQDLEPLIEVETDRVTPRDKRDYILLNMSEEERYELVTREERRELDGPSEEYQLEVERITDEQIDSLSDQELQVAAIYREMARGYANSPQRIKQRITDEEAHLISENLDRLPGIDIARHSSRSYPYGDSFQSLFGSTRQIPSERVDYYLSRGYERSDIVGTSYLEAQYEEVLRGQKAIVESVTKREGTRTIDRTVNERLGQRGNDLVLTLDMELQQRLEDIIDEEIRKSGNSFILDRSAYAVLMDPRTGDILAMAGFWDQADRERNSYADHAGNVNKVFEMGSSVKAASVLTGFHAGVASPGTRFNDRPIYLPSTPPKRSWNTSGFGWIDDRRALEQSSNVYMFEIGMRMANCYYTAPNTSCGWTTGSGGTVERAYQEVRNNFSQFGLGSETGIDLPSYSSGLTGGSESGGNLLDLMIGQYDNYTTLQLAQYIATIANDGYRMEPRLVREIREPSTNQNEQGAVMQKFEPTILNRIEMSDAHISRVQQGLRDVMTRGTARGNFANASYQPAGKTGTAQVKVAVGQGDHRRVVDGNTQSLVGYAPFNNPEIAFAVVVPDVKLGSNGGRQGIAQEISKSALEAYFELKEKRNGAKPIDEPLLEEVNID
ncbi:peptidoglycan D,D-transpeptidase FtsI family protein [Halalkalibacter alkaliphilus]|uniref:serine-type D-Ala-D-Ala carboxypeptidase n=1 Tax=Halalkalibacter alkaliphilus TaxID=2917993 RepID=A0A9X2CU73_9BACI|nr:penicillin-binding protein 2 [Halalkalibacter alkaliphilus]MCL7748376.1 penicillin-binding protein 2 [Halalkalibacter alkaliphilus]